ncbi:MAG: hypothetical protein WCX27_00675 [Candidatus Paceibacterota bacterium]|jgi:hypothetical protein
MTKENHETGPEDIESIKERVFKRVKEIYELYPLDDIVGKIHSLESKLKEKGINAKDYRFFHKLIGSSPREQTIEFDTPDHDIEKFIMSM